MELLSVGYIVLPDDSLIYETFCKKNIKNRGDCLIDTVCFITPKVPKLYIEKIQKKLKWYFCYDRIANKTIYDFTTGQICGSYDSSINIKINQDNTLKLTCSVHKIIIGHNIAYGSDNLLLLANCLKKIIYDYFEVKLPDVIEWELIRCDYTLTYDLGTQENVESYINALRMTASYSRRETDGKDNQGVWLNGATTTIKFYNKQREFIKHDYKKIKEVVGIEKAEELLELSAGLLRVEVSIYSRKIKKTFTNTIYRKTILKEYKDTFKIKNKNSLDLKLFKEKFKNNKVVLKDFRIDKIIKLWESEVLKVIKDKNNTILINKDSLVLEKLKENFSTRKVGSLYSFWTLLSTRGELYVKEQYNKATFYRLRKELIECGISWKDTNIYIKTEHKVISFVPVLDSPFLYDFNEPNDEFKEKVYQLLRGA